MADGNELRPRREPRIIGGPRNGYFLVEQDRCIRCGDCVKVCKYNDIIIEDNEYRINRDACPQCGVCAEICPNGAVYYLNLPDL